MIVSIQSSTARTPVALEDATTLPLGSSKSLTQPSSVPAAETRMRILVFPDRHLMELSSSSPPAPYGSHSSCWSLDVHRS